MDTKNMVQQCISKCEVSASDLRSAAAQTHNAQAKNTLQQSAQMIDSCVQQCKSVLPQL